MTGGIPPVRDVTVTCQKMKCINMFGARGSFRFMMEAIQEEKLCTICLNPSDFQDGYTYCCREPIHYNCMETLMYDDHLERHWNEIKCPFCKMLLNSKEYDEKVEAEEKRLAKFPYFEDKKFMWMMKNVWGNRLFWRNGEDQCFYGQMKNQDDKPEIVYLGSDKTCALERAKRYVNSFQFH